MYLCFDIFLPCPKPSPQGMTLMKEWVVWSREMEWRSSLPLGCRGWTSRGEEGHRWAEVPQVLSPSSSHFLLHPAVLALLFPPWGCSWTFSSSFSKIASCLASWSQQLPSGVALRYSPWWLILLIVEQQCFVFFFFHFHFHNLIIHKFSWWPTICHFIKAHLHTQSCILVLGLGLGHMLFSWWPTMYHIIKAYLHHPYSITHIGIGSWHGPCVVSWWPTM